MSIFVRSPAPTETPHKPKTSKDAQPVVTVVKLLVNHIIKILLANDKRQTI